MLILLETKLEKKISTMDMSVSRTNIDWMVL